jgi:hypothetical protein
MLIYNSTVQRPSPKRATSNRVFGIRGEKGGGLSAFCDYACTVTRARARAINPARTGKGQVRYLRVHYFCRIFTEKTMELLK